MPTIYSFFLVLFKKIVQSSINIRILLGSYKVNRETHLHINGKTMARIIYRVLNKIK